MTKQQNQNTFAEAVKRGQAICYEVVPPSQSLSDEKLQETFSDLKTALSRYQLSAIFIPEVINEENRADHDTRSAIAKLTPRNVADHLRADNVPECVIARPIVHLPWEEQKKWLRATHKEGINTLLLVGGDSSKKTYPGLSVVQTARELTDNTASETKFFLGGITIPTRKREAERVAKKSLAGIQFFTTQILYESETIKQLLREYWHKCLHGEAEARMVLLAFAPMTTTQNIRFYQSLGVEIPEETIHTLQKNPDTIESQSLQICEDILNDVLHFVDKEHIGIPLGLNISHVTGGNVAASFKLLDRLSSVYLKSRPFLVEEKSEQQHSTASLIGHI